MDEPYPAIAASNGKGGIQSTTTLEDPPPYQAYTRDPNRSPDGAFPSVGPPDVVLYEREPNNDLGANQTTRGYANPAYLESDRL